jgi:predicted RND superfamily exporter protein
MAEAADRLRQVSGTDDSQAAKDARRLAAVLDKFAAGDAAMRARAAQVFVPSLVTLLDQLRGLLQAAPVTLETLPQDLVRDWITADGRARTQVFPKGDSRDNETLERFTQAVRALAPDATGTPISIQEASRTVKGAFIQAGIWSLLSITVLLCLVLRRVRDVVLTLIPILLTGLLTLSTCVLIGQPINFANIIVLPLLFGIGVAFNIYFVMAWRAGTRLFLQSSLTRAVLFSALTTASAFGSLWLSSHPGTASMGKLLMISLAWTLIMVLLFQPALLLAESARQDSRS